MNLVVQQMVRKDGSPGCVTGMMLMLDMTMGTQMGRVPPYCGDIYFLEKKGAQITVEISVEIKKKKR